MTILALCVYYDLSGWTFVEILSEFLKVMNERSPFYRSTFKTMICRRLRFVSRGAPAFDKSITKSISKYFNIFVRLMEVAWRDGEKYFEPQEWKKGFKSLSSCVW